jgi:hypothetical protein
MRYPLLILCLLLPCLLHAQDAAPEALYDRMGDATAWELDPGREFPGADGKITVAAEAEGVCLRLDYDFTGGGSYVTASRALTIPRASAVAFSVRQEGGNRGFVRIADASGQEHIAGYSASSPWQRVTLPLDGQTFAGHYYGKDDGQFVFPLGHIIIGVSSGPSKQGTVFLKDLAFVSSDPAVQFGARFTLAEPGHILFVGQAASPLTITLENRINAPAKLGVRGTVRDWYGAATRFTATLPPTPAHGVSTYPLALRSDRPNYYVITAEPVCDGKPLAPVTTGVVVAPRPLNYGVDDPRSFFALQLGSDGARAERVGCKWVRVGRDWRWADLGEGRYWLPDLQPLRAAHQLIMYNLSAYPPPWAMASNPEATFWEAPGWEQRTQWWAAFVEHTAHDLAPYVDTFEIQNEPDLTCMYQVGLDFAAGTERYLRILRAAVPAVRRGAPHARLAGIDVSGGDYDGTLAYSKAIEAQAGTLLDVDSGHPYAGVRYFGEGESPLWPVPNQERRKCQDTLKMIAAAGLKQHFWVGEKGWGLDVKTDPLSGYSRDFAACLVQSLTLAHSVPGVERYFWFLDDGCNEGGYEYGLWRHGMPLPAALAYATLARVLHHATPQASPDLGALVQAHCFTSADTASGVTVLWSEGERASLRFSRLPADVTALDLMGRKLAVGKAGRPFALALRRAPVYLTYALRSADRMAAAVARASATNEQPVLLEAAFAADLRHLGARLHNVTNQPQAVRITGPSGPQSLTLAPGESRRVLLPVAQPLTALQGRELPVRMTVRQDTQAATVKVALSPLPAVPAAAGQPLPPLSWWQQRPAIVLDNRAQIYPPDPTVGWQSPADLSVRAWWGWDAKYLHLAAVIHDPVHHAPSADPDNFWQADSLQIGLDPLNDAPTLAGYLPDDREFGLVLGPNGARVTETAPQPGRLDVPVAIERQGTDTIYRVALPWAVIGTRPTAGAALGLSFIVNQNNGQGRGYWMGLTPGIGEAKRPLAFRKLYLEAPRR